MGKELDSIMQAISSGEVNNPKFWVKTLKDLYPLCIKQTDDNLEKIKISRYFIQTIYDMDQDELEGFLGLKIVNNSKSLNGIDCHGYLFGSGTAEEILNDFFENWELAVEAKPDSYALYLNDELSKPLHIGKVGNDLKVVSKWGINGYVFSHHPYLVPAQYGWNIAYFSKEA